MSYTPLLAQARHKAMDGNLLKPMLARGNCAALGQHPDEYRKYIEKDAALERRFQQVFVASPRLKPQFQFCAV